MSDITLNRNRGNLASKDAYERVKPTVAQMKSLIVDYIWKHNGVTSDEVQAYLRRVSWHPDNFPPNVVSPRLSELKRDNLIRSSGLRNGFQVFVKCEAQLSFTEVA